MTFKFIEDYRHGFRWMDITQTEPGEFLCGVAEHPAEVGVAQQELLGLGVG